MTLEFWLSYNNNAERLRLPVNPEVLSVSSPFSHTDVSIAALGEVSIFGERGLKEFSFQTFFPKTFNQTYCSYTDFPTPDECIEIIERWRDTRRPIRFIVTGTKVNYAVTIREFEYDLERAGHNGDVYFSLELKEYRFLNVREETIIKSKKSKRGSKKKQRPPIVNKDTTIKTNGSYIVKSGDSLSKIAKDVYGNANQWRKIYDANKKVIGANPNKIKEGTKLVIPK